jgi:chorismate mutase
MIKEDVLRKAREAAVINSVLELQYHRQLDPALIEEVLRLIGSSSIPTEPSTTTDLPSN